MYYKINKEVASKIEYKGELSNLDLLGIKAYLKEAFKSKGSKAYKYSTYHSEPAVVDLYQSIGSSYQLTIKDQLNDHHVIRLLKVSENDILFLETYEGETIKVELGPLTN